MILGTKARYAVMAMVEMAGRNSNVPVTLSDLSKSQEITLPYLEQIFRKLRSAGLVKSVRGPGGGYILLRCADDISIADIVMAVDESIQMTRCEAEKTSGCMAGKAKCLTHNLWDGLGKHIYSYLDSFSLADVRNNNKKISS